MTHPYAINAIATDEQIGNAFAHMLSPDPAATQQFTIGGKLREIGSSATSPTAWFTDDVLPEVGYARSMAFRGDTREQIIAAGVGEAEADNAMAWISTIPSQTLTAGRAAITFEVGPRETIRGRGLAYLAEQGYESLPTEGV